MIDRFSTLVPRPRHAVAAGGVFEFGRDTAVDAGSEIAGVVRVLLAPLRLPLPVRTDSPNTVRIRLGDLEPEEYRLEIGGDQIAITAGELAGVRHAVFRLLQLLPDEIWRAAPARGTPWTVPRGEIIDRPALAWRGGMLDVSRHFFPKRTILRYVDLLAMHGLNRLHLHLTDDQGWRIESPNHPELTRIGSHRPETTIGLEQMPGWDTPTSDGTPHGGFYSTADLAEINAYAAERGVTIVPEINLPGHCSALLAARPDLGIGDHTVRTGGGIYNAVVKPLPGTVDFLATVLEDLLTVIPTPYMHLGGDEVVVDDWTTDPDVVAYMRKIAVDDPVELHGHFLRQLAARLAQIGVRTAVWDEAFVSGGLLDDSIVLAWRGHTVARRAAAAGYDVVRCPIYPTYFDYRQSDDPGERLSLNGPVTLTDVASFHPRPDDWAENETAPILGTQFQVWTEFIPDEQHLDSMVFPRACALAEVAWTGMPADPAELTARLETHLRRLDAAGVDYRPPSGPLPWQTGGTGPRRGQRSSIPFDKLLRYVETMAESATPTYADNDTVRDLLGEHTGVVVPAADIDRSAPVVVSRTIVIDAPIDVIWNLHTDVAAWSRWNPATSNAWLDGPLAPGSVLGWHSGDLEITSTVHTVEPCRRTVWGGNTLGIIGIHAFTFEPMDARTRVVTEESWSGPPVAQDPSGMRQALDQSLWAWLIALSAAAESK